MDLTGQEHTGPQEIPSGRDSTQLLVDKNELIKALKDLLEKYPSEMIPLEAVEGAFGKFTAIRDLGRLTNNPAIEKLDKMLARYKIT